MENQEKENQYQNFLIAKKAEKVVTAIYLITQFLENTENIKLSLRKEADELLKITNGFAYTQDENIFLDFEKSLTKVLLLISYLTLAKNTNLISRMNVQIVLEALRILENSLTKRKFALYNNDLKILEEDNLTHSQVSEEVVGVKNNTSYDVLTERNLKFNFSDFLSGQEKLKTQKVVEPEVSAYKGQKEILVKDKEIKTIYKGQNKTMIKDNNLKKSKVKPLAKNELATPKAPIKKRNVGKKNARKEEILSLFSPGIEVSIIDISNRIVDCSTKTIQRELNDLVQEHKLERIGDRRWSKYTLAK